MVLCKMQIILVLSHSETLVHAAAIAEPHKIYTHVIVFLKCEIDIISERPESFIQVWLGDFEQGGYQPEISLAEDKAKVDSLVNFL
jgi:hypothetical protein